MSTKELKEEILKVVDGSENTEFLENVLAYANQLLTTQKKYSLDELDMKILKEDEGLLKRLAK